PPPHPYDEDGGATVDLALNRATLPGLVRVQRIRASLRMPGMTMAITSNPAAYLVGQGPADEEDVPALVAQLKSPDASERAEAADDLPWPGGHAAPRSRRLPPSAAALRRPLMR